MNKKCFESSFDQNKKNSKTLTTLNWHTHKFSISN